MPVEAAMYSRPPSSPPSVLRRLPLSSSVARPPVFRVVSRVLRVPSMNKIKLTIATTDYDHFRDFRTGAVQAEGIEHIWLTLGHHEIFSRFTFNREWDVTELSFAKFTAQVTRDNPDIIGLPVFASRLFRFGSFYVNRKSGIKTGGGPQGPVDRVA